MNSQRIQQEGEEKCAKNSRKTRENAAEKVVMDRNKLSSKRALDTML
jgi:hypothetical protein